MTPYRPTERSEQRKAEMRARILDAARALFTAQGYDATTMKQVVAEAGTSIGNLYFYFPNKEALLLAVTEAVNAEIAEAVGVAMAQTPPGPERLAAVIYAGVEVVFTQETLLRQLLVESSRATLRRAIIDYATERTRRFFTAAPEALGGLPLELACHAYQGAIFNVLERALLGDVDDDPAALARFLTRWNMQALGFPADVIDGALAALDDYVAEQVDS
jgi:AcrR family transcriptional regulator